MQPLLRACDIKHIESSSMTDKLPVGSFISKISLCENRQKQQKEAFSYFD